MASAAGSTADIEPAERLKDWFRVYISKLEDWDKQSSGYFSAYILLHEHILVSNVQS